MRMYPPFSLPPNAPSPANNATSPHPPSAPTATITLIISLPKYIFTIKDVFLVVMLASTRISMCAPPVPVSVFSVKAMLPPAPIVIPMELTNSYTMPPAKYNAHNSTMMIPHKFHISASPVSIPVYNVVESIRVHLV